MADCNTTSRRRYLPPPTVIKEVPGVVRTRHGLRADSFVGTAESLTAAGLLPSDKFPGQPGMPVSRATFRPIGFHAKGNCGWSGAPGYMEVFRRPDGKFRIVMTVSTEEQEARRAIHREQRAAQEALNKSAEAAAEAVLAQLSSVQREYVENIVRHSGLRRAKDYFRDLAHLAKSTSERETARSVLSGLEIYVEADIERRLVLHPMTEATALIARAVK